MRIVLSIPLGSDKSEGIHYERVLRRLGHELLVVSVPSVRTPERNHTTAAGYRTRTRLEELEIGGAPPDLFLYVEPHGLIPVGIENAPFPTAAIICDCHQGLAHRQRLAKFFQHVFLYHRNYVTRFEEHGPGYVHWLPYACDTLEIRPSGAPRDLDVAFVGVLFGPGHERRRVLKKVEALYRSNPARYYRQEEIPALYSRAKIVLNLPLGDDLNFRFFEAMSCGAMLLTRRVANGQEELFEEGVHFQAFDGDEELFDKLAYYSKHDRERERIAAAGLAEITAKHTLELRLGSLLRTVQASIERPAPAAALPPSELDSLYAWLYESWRDAGAGLELIREARDAGRPWIHLAPSAARTAARVLFR